MKHSQNINKEDLWNKILEDERMPKPETKRLFLPYLFAVAMIIAILTIFIETTGNKLLERSTARHALQETENIKTLLPDDKSIIVQGPKKNQTLDNLNTINDQIITKTFIKEHSKKELTKLKSEDNGHQVKDQYHNKNTTVTARKKNKINPYDYHTSIPSFQIVNSSDPKKTKDVYSRNSTLQPANIKSISPIKPLQITCPKWYRPTAKIEEVTVNLSENKTQQKSSFIFFNIGYGGGFRNILDIDNQNINDSTALESNLSSYMVELGMYKNLGKWQISGGIGIDILQGKGNWSSTDTIYSFQADRTNYERYRQISTYKLYQKYVHLYALASVSYQFSNGNWALIPSIGLRFNFLNLSSGTNIEAPKNSNILRLNLDDSSRISMRFALNYQRRLNQRFTMNISSRYESATSFQIDKNNKHSVAPLGFSVGLIYNL